MVDAAQMAAHLSDPDDRQRRTPRPTSTCLIFSGHKIYAPGSPGVVVTRKDLFEGLEPQEVGGGMVEDVYLNRHVTMEEFPDREEAGTPNISGAIGLAAALYAPRAAWAWRPSPRRRPKSSDTPSIPAE